MFFGFFILAGGISAHCTGQWLAELNDDDDFLIPGLPAELDDLPRRVRRGHGDLGWSAWGAAPNGHVVDDATAQLPQRSGNPGIKSSPPSDATMGVTRGSVDVAIAKSVREQNAFFKQPFLR